MPIDRRDALAEGLLLIALGLRRVLLARRLEGQEHAAGRVAQIDLPPRRRDEHPPAARPEEHRDRIARSVHVALPARFHGVERAAAVELHCLLAPVLPFLRPRSAFAEAEHRMLVELERQRTVVGEHDFLYQLAGGVPDDERQRTPRQGSGQAPRQGSGQARPHFDVELADFPVQGTRDLTHAQRRRRIRARGERRVLWKVGCEGERPQRHADARVARHADIELRGLPGGGNLLCRRCPVRGQREGEQRQTDRDTSGGAHMRRSVAHGSAGTGHCRNVVTSCRRPSRWRPCAWSANLPGRPGPAPRSPEAA